jgi:hypothetical protein
MKFPWLLLAALALGEAYLVMNKITCEHPYTFVK